MCKILYTIYLCGHRKVKIEDCPEGLAAKGAYPCGGPYFWNHHRQHRCGDCIKHDAIAQAQKDAGMVLHQCRPLHSRCCDLKARGSPSSGSSSSQCGQGASFDNNEERVEGVRGE